MKRKIVTKLMAIVLAGVLLTGSVTPGFSYVACTGGGRFVQYKV